jgi:hypothetical protein
MVPIEQMEERKQLEKYKKSDFNTMPPEPLECLGRGSARS